MLETKGLGSKVTWGTGNQMMGFYVSKTIIWMVLGA